MTIFNFFKSKAAQAALIKKYDYALMCVSDQGAQDRFMRIEVERRIHDLEAENAELRRQNAGYKAGVRRRKNKEVSA